MKKYLLPLLIFAFACSSPSGENEADKTAEPAEQIEETSFFTADPQPMEEVEVTTLSIGSPAPYFNLPGVDGQYHSIDDYADSDVLVVIFTCNHCPTAQAYEERIKALVNDYSDKSVQVVAISPNSPVGLMYNELGYTDLGDTFDDMIVRANDMQFNFPYLYDGDTHEYSLAYGPVATPHAFVFD